MALDAGVGTRKEGSVRSPTNPAGRHPNSGALTGSSRCVKNTSTSLSFYFALMSMDGDGEEERPTPTKEQQKMPVTPKTKQISPTQVIFNISSEVLDQSRKHCENNLLHLYWIACLIESSSNEAQKQDKNSSITLIKKFTATFMHYDSISSTSITTQATLLRLAARLRRDLKSGALSLPSLCPLEKSDAQVIQQNFLGYYGIQPEILLSKNMILNETLFALYAELRLYDLRYPAERNEKIALDLCIQLLKLLLQDLNDAIVYHRPLLQYVIEIYQRLNSEQKKKESADLSNIISSITTIILPPTDPTIKTNMERRIMQAMLERNTALSEPVAYVQAYQLLDLIYAPTPEEWTAVSEKDVAQKQAVGRLTFCKNAASEYRKKALRNFRALTASDKTLISRLPLRIGKLSFPLQDLIGDLNMRGKQETTRERYSSVTNILARHQDSENNKQRRAAEQALNLRPCGDLIRLTTDPLDVPALLEKTEEIYNNFNDFYNMYKQILGALINDSGKTSKKLYDLTRAFLLLKNRSISRPEKLIAVLPLATHIYEHVSLNLKTSLNNMFGHGTLEHIHKDILGMPLSLLHGKIHAAHYDKTSEAHSRNEAFDLCAQFIKDIGLSVHTKILSATLTHHFHIKQAVSLMMELLGKEQTYNTLSEILGKPSKRHLLQWLHLVFDMQTWGDPQAAEFMKEAIEQKKLFKLTASTSDPLITAMGPSVLPLETLGTRAYPTWQLILYVFNLKHPERNITIAPSHKYKLEPFLKNSNRPELQARPFHAETGDLPESSGQQSDDGDSSRSGSPDLRASGENMAPTRRKTQRTWGGDASSPPKLIPLIDAESTTTFSLSSLKDAVSEAQKKYERETKTFSLRHGKFGKRRFENFKNKINGCATEADARKALGEYIARDEYYLRICGKGFFKHKGNLGDKSSDKILLEKLKKNSELNTAFGLKADTALTTTRTALIHSLSRK